MSKLIEVKRARQDRFVDEYLKDLNATQAAIRAGYSPKTAREQASRLLAKVNIQEEVAGRARQRQEDARIETTRVLTENARIALSDIRKLFNENGTLKPVHEWAADIAGAVASVEIFEEYQREGNKRKIVGHIKKVRFWDKNTALDRLFKHFGLFDQDNRQKLDPVAELLKAIDGHAKLTPPGAIAPAERLGEPRQPH